MKLIKIILTKEKDLKNNLKKIINLKEIKKEINFTIFEWERMTFKGEELIVYIIFKNFEKTIKYIKENYEIFKIIIPWKARNIGNIDLKPWDIIIPNTFIKKNENPIFLEYAIWKNYDLKKFWLSLSWICLSWDNYKTNDFIADIQDKDSFNILKSLKEKNLIDKVVILKEIIKEKENGLKNIINVVDLVL